MSNKRNNSGRHQFDAVYVLRQARGLPTTEGHAVITKEFAQFLEDELERLYAIEEAATAVFEQQINVHIPDDISESDFKAVSDSIGFLVRAYR